MKLLIGSRIVLGLALMIGTVPSISATDWPTWRGPNRDGLSTETGLLKSWPAEGPKLEWTARGLGLGYSSVVVVGQRVFTMGDKDEAAQVVAINAVDGKIVWSVKVGKAGASGGFDGPRSSVTASDGLLFAEGQFGELVCLESGSGREVWRKSFSGDFGGKSPHWGFSESTLVDGDKVIFTPGGSKGAVVALNKKTGALIWQSQEFIDAAHYASLVPAEIGGVRQYIQLTEASVAGIAAGDGKLLWRAPRKGATAVIPTPIYYDGYVYVTSGYGIGCNAFKISAQDGKFSAEEVYANKAMVNHHGGVIRVGPNVYGHSDSKGWTCQELKTGNVIWQEKSKLGKGSIAYADGHFYLRAESGKGTVVLIEATPAGWKESGRFDQPARSEKNSWPHPVVAGGRLYLRDQDVLLCYDVSGSAK